MTSVIKQNLMPSAVNKELEPTATKDAATTMDDGNGSKEEGQTATIWRVGKRGKRRRCQRNRTASCSSDKQCQCVGVTRRQKRHIQSVADNGSNRTAAKGWHNEQQRIKTARVETVAEGDADDGAMAGGRTQKSGTFARHQSQQLQSRNSLKPRAPSNTTSFLMSDLEKRQQHEEDEQQHQHVDVLADAVGVTRSGQKTLAKKVGQSNANGELTTTMMVSRGLVEDDDGTDIEEEQRDADFEECFFTTSIERIERLSREEVNRELLLVDRDNRMLKQRMALLKESYQQMQEENQKLKSLLKNSET